MAALPFRQSPFVLGRENEEIKLWASRALWFLSGSRLHRGF